MYIHHTLQRYIATALRDFDVREHDIHLEHPADFMHGDYAINSALIYARNRGIAPRELAEQFVQELTKDMPAYLERIEIAGPGFINLFLARPFLQSTLADIIADSVHYGRGSLLSGKRVLIEHSSPNLFKPFHIGHMMNNAIGESLVRTAEYVGGDVIALSYPSDISLGIGKAIWFLLSNGGKEALAERATLHEQILLLGSCYVQGVRAFDDTPEIQSDVREITRQIFEQEPTPAYELYTLCKQLNIDYFIAITKRLGSHFADFIFESEAGVRGQDMVRAHTPSVFRVSNGAHIYEGEQDGLHTRVFINAEGYPTYEAKDIGLLAIKFERYQPDISVLITDHEQKEYYKVVLAAAGNIAPVWRDCSVHVTHGRMTLLGQKMSSRLGGVPTAVELLDTLRSDVYEKNTDASDDLADAIALAAIKFTILKTQAGKNINFDPDQSLSFEGDSGPYLQYTHARIQSLLTKGEGMGIHPRIDGALSEEVLLERMLYRFPHILERVIKDYSPHHLAHYALEVARVFNSWYGGTKILDPENPHAPYYLGLAQATGIILERSLYLLGIHAPERM